MYDVLPSFILGFHGCDETVAEQVFSGKASLKKSDNKYDWLGSGVYFWENSPQRALDYATALQKNPRRTGPKIKAPAVVGAVVDLGRCLNLIDHEMIQLVSDAHDSLADAFSKADATLPENVGGSDLVQRFLDRAVIAHLHSMRADDGKPEFDSVRAVFVEGSPIYEKAGFYAKTHIQICVRNLRCIKGYFRVLPDPGT